MYLKYILNKNLFSYAVIKTIYSQKNKNKNCVEKRNNMKGKLVVKVEKKNNVTSD